MFSYTEGWANLNSSLVKAVYYDASKRQMLVRLTGEKQYRYENVDRNDAASLANAGSVGAAYNRFRRHRGRGQGGASAHGEVVVASNGGRRTTVTAQPTSTFARLNPGDLASKVNYEATFELSGNTHKSTVEATSISEAATTVESQLKSLGLPARLTGVVVKR